MLQDELKEGTPVILEWDSEYGHFRYKSYVLIKEGSLVGLSAVYDPFGKFIDFKTGTVTLSTMEGDYIYDHIVIRPVLHQGTNIYLTYGKKNSLQVTYVRRYPRFSVNKDCTLNDRHAKLFDLSEGGFGVIVNKEYKVGIWTQLAIDSARVFGKIVHVKEIGFNTWFYGCEVETTDSAYLKVLKNYETLYEESIS